MLHAFNSVDISSFVFCIVEFLLVIVSVCIGFCLFRFFVGGCVVWLVVCWLVGITLLVTLLVCVCLLLVCWWFVVFWADFGDLFGIVDLVS